MLPAVHIHGVNHVADDPQPTNDAATYTRIVDAEGRPVMSVNALIARLRISSGRADLESVCQVLPVLAGANAAKDYQGDGLAEWENRVADYALGIESVDEDNPAVAELQRLDAVRATQHPLPARNRLLTPLASRVPGADIER